MLGTGTATTGPYPTTPPIESLHLEPQIETKRQSYPPPPPTKLFPSVCPGDLLTRKFLEALDRRPGSIALPKIPPSRFKTLVALTTRKETLTKPECNWDLGWKPILNTAKLII